jgi:hypothetical protein
LGEHRRYETDGMRRDIEAPGCRSSACWSIAPICWHAGHE